MERRRPAPTRDDIRPRLAGWLTAALGTAWLSSALAMPYSRLVDVEVVERAEETVIELRIAGRFSHHTFVLSAPDRFICDLADVAVARSRTLPVDGDAIARVRIAQYSGRPVPIARLVVDLEEPLPPEIDRLESGLRLRFRHLAGAARRVQEDVAEPGGGVRVTDGPRDRPESTRRPAAGPQPQSADGLVAVDPPLVVAVLEPIAHRAGEAVATAGPSPGAGSVAPASRPAGTPNAAAEANRLEPEAGGARLVRKDGVRVETVGSWKMEDDWVIYRERSGSLVALRASLVDFEKSAGGTLAAREQTRPESGQPAPGLVLTDRDSGGGTETEPLPERRPQSGSRP